MERVAFVAVGEPLSDGPRLARSSTSGEVTLIAPRELAAALGRSASWFEGELAAPVEQLLPGLRALRALEALGSFDRIQCTPEGAWAIASAMRTGGLRTARVVVEVSPGHAALTRPVATGERYPEVIFREALLHGLRDAAAVEGDAAAIGALREAGAILAEEPPAPAWDSASPPAITAVVTHKDLQRYLPECLASLRAQTVPLEILVIDDGSGPEGLAALDDEERKDPKLRVVRRRHVGLSGARTFGVQEARTELVLIVDADNVMRPNLAERLREALRLRPAAAAATGGFRAFDGETSATLWYYSPTELSPPALFLANTGGDACALHRRSALLAAGGYEPEEEFSEDWDLWLRYLDRGFVTAPVFETLFDYRVRKDSLLRLRSPANEAAMQFKLVALHPQLAVANARELVLLAAGELVMLQNRGRAADVLARASGEITRAAQASFERAARAEAVSAAAEAARAAAERDRESAERDRESAERDREAARANLTAARQELDGLHAALAEMAGSSAVRLARTLRSLSPAAHSAIARALRFALTLKR
jgi:GT2 family glycosyltransferase